MLVKNILFIFNNISKKEKKQDVVNYCHIYGLRMILLEWNTSITI